MSEEQDKKVFLDLIDKYIKENIKFYPDQERFKQYCISLELNPHKDDIVYTSRWDKIKNCATRGTIIVPFDTVLSKAWSTGKFLGFKTEEVFQNNKLFSVKCVAKRKISNDIAEIEFTAYLSEFLPKGSSGFSPWSSMPTVMLRKCAAANAIRQLFADVLKGVYTAEEMDQDDSIITVEPMKTIKRQDTEQRENKQVISIKTELQQKEFARDKSENLFKKFQNEGLDESDENWINGAINKYYKDEEFKDYGEKLTKICSFYNNLLLIKVNNIEETAPLLSPFNGENIFDNFNTEITNTMEQ